MIRLRFLLAFRTYAKGAIIEPPASLAQQLLAMRWYGEPIVELVDDEPKPMARKTVVDRKRSAVASS